MGQSPSLAGFHSLPRSRYMQATMHTVPDIAPIPLRVRPPPTGVSSIDNTQALSANDPARNQSDTFAKALAARPGQQPAAVAADGSFSTRSKLAVAFAVIACLFVGRVVDRLRGGS